MKFEYDIFISYGPSVEKEGSWINHWAEKFCEYLAILLTRLTDQKPTILLHDDLRTRKKLLGNEIANIFSKTAVFVTIIDPGYLESKEYLAELEKIYEIIYLKSDDTSRSTNRLFKVLTSPIDEGLQPDFLKNELSYDFYEINRFNKKVKVFSIKEQDETYDKFWSKLVDLAYDVYNSLYSQTSDETVTKKQEEKKFIYLAETTADQQDNRDILKRELQHLGYGILPLTQLPDESDKLSAAIQNYLKRAVLSVHLMGAYYGDYVKNSKYSLIDFQNQSSKSFIEESGEAGKFSRIIWIPNDLKPANQQQSLYLKRLKRDEAKEKTEIIEAPLELFKSILNNKLEELNEPTKDKPQNKVKIYLVYEHHEKNNINNLIKEINKKDYQIIDNDFGSSERNLVTKHIENLIEADAVIIFKGSSGIEWLNSKIRDLIKAPGYGKTRPFASIGIISDQKPDMDIMNFITGSEIIFGKEINSSFLVSFLKTLNLNNGKRS
ncbi:MAG: hypothetical protein JSV22_09035 [Bacteroidales bacterium]|nr:MAG: hypothetical protein JSV22_09035 [Bacteroidales bacterium]